ncbi:T9SS type B sorting domain-containing protein [Allomuricauda sp. d1]|uniref:T9SS type B sorting domain-containing protein n=1 Tax=Allomuricauda sp. d1 TaxID=3136725 RepID=UPI0031D8AF94
MAIKNLWPFAIACLFTLIAHGQEAVPFVPRLDGDNIKIRGDIIFVGNNILNRATETNPAQANTPYNGSQNNNSLWMEYIDIDSDPTTFSSSSAELNITDPSCSQVRYAGLYWAATYPNERSTNGGAPFDGTPRIEDWFNIKFMVPGGAYVDLTADTAADPVGQEDDIIFDGYDYSNINNSFKDSPYICYKNVTDLVRSNANPNGEYTVANVRATKGRRNGSSSAGWVMVIIYENPNESGKFISTFDGYAGMSGAVGNVEVDVDGFRTLPAPFPVRARIGVGALEGDRGIRNDRFFIRADLNAGNPFTNLSTGNNPANNFFNSTITNNGNQVPTRTPYGTNTLGTDLDIFNLNNPNETVLPNDETGATLRFTSTGDGYGAFLAAFSVEIIEPNIVLEKRVEDIGGTDITGQGVNLGQLLDYVLSFTNLGNDDATNYTIRDVLPVNTTLDETNITMPPGVTYTFDSATNEIVFSIPDNLVEIGDPIASIRMRVRVAENCFDFVDACSDLIENLAYSTYQGALNSAVITDDPSVSDFDNCGFVTPGATNFLLDDLENCSYTRTVLLCGSTVELDAGDGFDSYTWYFDNNGDQLIDAGDTVITDGDPDSDPSTFVADRAGTFIVDKDVADPCKGFQEVIIVDLFGSTQTNPITTLINDTSNTVDGQILVCPNDGEELPEIFLCGLNDTELVQINIPDADSIVWEQLDEASCAAATPNCPNRDNGCAWNTVATGSDFMADDAGQYRLSINYANGCFSRFYFNVFKNNLDPNYTSEDIFCTTPGNITVTNMPANYEYQLVNETTGAIEVPYSANNGPSFTITNNGAYRVEMRQQGVTDGCTFMIENIGVLDRDFQVDIDITPANCNALGAIEIDVLNVNPNYNYYLRRQSDGVLIDDETAQPDNTHTFTVNPGDYTIEVTTQDGCTDSQDITVGRIPDPDLSAVTIDDIGCTAGRIDLTRTGGQGNPDFLFAIWSKDGVILHHPGGSPTEQDIVNNIPADAYQVDPFFLFGWRDDDGDGSDEYIPNEDGDYVFIVVDANNCYALSNEVTINDLGQMTASVPTPVDVSCSGGSDGEINIVAVGGIAPYTYSIDGGATFVGTASFVNRTAGNYNVVVRDSSGCEVSFLYTVNEPFPLTASAGISRDATCDPNGAEVRVTNVTGGTAPYEYSFDGGATYGGSSIAVLPPGDYTVIVRDDNDCTFSMDVSVDDDPMPPTVTLTPEVSYNCDGTGTITATPDIATYDYTYELDGVPNAPPTSNVWNNVSPGTYTVRTYYTSTTPPTPSILLNEDFGAGATIASPNTTGYCFEPQDGTNTCLNPAPQINDGEYAVTSSIVAPFGAWVNPTDHTGLVNGRYLVINIGSPGPGQAIYRQVINDIVPNRPIEVSLWAINLLRSTHTGQVDPDLTIELRDTGTGALVASDNTNAIPRNDLWNNYPILLNPGPNTSLELVIVTNESDDNGNDVAIDDIVVLQEPEVCSQFVETPVTVVAGNTFSASVTNFTNASCNGLSDGTITFEVENFDAAAGFDYSTDGGTNWTNSTMSPLTTTAIFGAGTHRIDIRKADDISCTTFVEETLTAPTPVVASAAITTPLTCTNGGATITASASGGTPTYVYQLEDNLGNVIGAYDFATNGNNTVFTGLAAGDYFVITRDANTCEDAIDTALTVADYNTIVFNTVETACYSGNNDGSIQVNVTDGNGDYQFRINGGAWITPTPATATTYTFQNLTNGSYTIEVRDGLGCDETSLPIILDPALTATVDVVDISNCGDGSITVNATGGSGTLVYAFVTNGTAVTPADFGAANTFAVTTGNDGDYDVYVRDNNGASPFCEYTETVTVNPATPLTITATPTDPQCHDGTGSIQVDLTSGEAPYTIQIIDLDNGGASDQTDTNVTVTNRTYFNLMPGNYTVNVTDADGCTVTDSPFISNPDELTADIEGIAPVNCDPNPNLYGFRFINYPLTIGTLEFSADGGATWQSSDTFVGAAYASGTEVEPAIRTVSGATQLCRTDLPRYTTPYPLDDLDISISAIIVDCNDLQVTVQGTEGLAPYEYAYSDDPVNFNPATATWFAGSTIDSGGNTVPAGHGRHIFTGLVPGRTYVFYVRDSSPCVRQSSQNVNDLAPPPVQIMADVTPTCAGQTNGQITYTVTEDTPGELGGTFDWDFFRIDDVAPFGPPVLVDSGTEAGFTSGDSFTVPTPASLGVGDYFVEIRGAAPNNCVIGSENARVEELNPITGTPNVLQNITCDNPGLVEIQSVFGGGGTYTYTLTSTNFVAPIVTTDNPVEIPIANLVDATITPFNVDVSVADQYGCTNPLGTVSITVAQNPNIDSITVANCTTPFSITVIASGGSGTYLYSIDGGATYVDNGGVFNNVAVGSYNIAIIDSNGCTDTNPVATEVYPTLQANAALTTAKDCESGVAGNAEITIEVFDGSGGTAVGAFNYDFEVTGPTAGSSQARTNLTLNPFVWNGASEVGGYTVLVYDNNVPSCPPRSFTVNVEPEVYPSLNIDAFSNETCITSDDGSISISAVDNGTGPFTFQITHLNGAPLGTPINPTSSTNVTAIFTGLQGSAAGNNYTITATAANHCTTTQDQIITEPDAIVVNTITPVEYGCSVGNNPDNATLTFAGAVGGSNNFVRFEFIRDGSPVQDGPNQTYTETDLAGGSYVINVYDDNGCVGSTTATVLPFVEISDPVINTTVDVTCNPGSDAQIEVGVTVNPGTATPNLEYVVTGINVVYGPQTITSTNHLETFTGLSAGNYSISITNLDTGCVTNTVHTVDEPEEMDVVATKLTDEECLNNGVDDGSFSITISDYVGDYSYQVYDSSDNPLPGAGFSGTGNTGTVLPPITNLSGGVYYIRITQTDAPFCVEDSNNITIIAPDAPITAAVSEEANVTCSNDQGVILVDPEGGQGPYTIVLDNTTTAQSYTETNVEAFMFNGLSAGTFDITITDAYGCVHTDNITLIQPDDIVASITSTALSCYNGNDASVTASIAPRTNPVAPVYEYRLNRYDDLAGTTLLSTSAPQSAATFNGLNTGFYSITVSDDVSCADETAIVEIINPTEVEAFLVRTNPLTCEDGVEFELSATGGSGTYEYSDDNITFIPMAGNSVNLPVSGTLGAGTYQYFVRDAVNGCVAVASNIIDEDPIIPLSLTLDTTAAIINCDGESTARIVADADGGLGNYMFELYTNYSGSLADLNNLDPALLNVADRIAGPSANGTFADLPAGTYYINVFSGDCTAPPQQVVIADPAPLTYSEGFADETCVGAEDGYITVTLSGGAGGYQYAISPNLDQFSDENTFTDLSPGNYTVIAQDQNGCFEVLDYTIGSATPITVTADTVTHEICAGDADGSITLGITGGVAPYRTSLNSNADADFVNGQVQFDNLAAGTYVIFVRDANDCETNIIVDVEPGVNLNATVTPIYECDGNIPENRIEVILEDDTASADVMYALDSTNPADMQLTPDFTNMVPGSHFLTIAHSNGCINTVDFEITGFEPLTLILEQNNINEITAVAAGGLEEYTFIFGDVDNGADNTFFINRTDTYTVTVIDQNGCEVSAEIFMEFIDIEIPNFFTPDGDGMNDRWLPDNLEAFPNVLMIIFDRYGRELYRMRYGDAGWNGIYQNSNLPTGDYWYVIKLQGEQDDREFVGHFTLYR